MNKKTFNLKSNLISAIAVGSFVIISLASGEDISNDEKTDSTEQKVEQKAENWNYSEEIDKMDGTKQFFATNTSTNQVEFEFPYDGGSTFDIIVRNINKDNEVLLTVSKGQFITSISGSETLKIKFDENKPENYSYNSASDASTDVIFLNDSEKFIKNIKKSKKVMIEATFFDAGSKIMEFNVEGLKWDK
jgi:hypothetical protein